MRISANPIVIWLAAFVGSAAAFGQSSPVLIGAAAYGDWRTDAPGVRRKITPADMPPPYATVSANNGPTVAERPPNAWPKAPPRVCRRARGHRSRQPGCSCSPADGEAARAEPARQIRPVERHREEEAQGRDRAVDSYRSD